MPTPSTIREQVTDSSHHSSCPPEDDRFSLRIVEMDSHNEGIASLSEVLQQPMLPTTSSIIHDTDSDQTLNDDENFSRDKESPGCTVDQKLVDSDDLDLPETELSSSLTAYDFSYIRLIPSSSSCFLRPGSRFNGTQQSERQVYDVQVEIKHVDMRESFLCGYLRIQGLTEDHPTLTTYFEGEIIGSKYTFLTQHQDWGSNDKVDLTHWAKFSSFRPFSKKAKKGKLTIPHLTQRENIFMRWKEHFLVPDHRVTTISGASFEGFYYICFNQVQGTVSGIYFHAKSEKFQQLELKHVEDRGCFAAMEFR
ncbi:Glucose-induced degradation protein 4-like protein [Golovinomyces cichoracearum]|uniref:Glucose-induced degradation protein 4-like protein n=1 Tax=Golovinomyces cichoracearum TaxID=62708 RepID=A0A420IJR1_9PEZI|nr:Glucose-induced degradation protein 4-like protein [Golovinomyces cichoracearum]